MEVRQYLRKEVDKKKEAVHQLKDEVEEVIEEALLGRRSRRSNDADNGNTVTSDETSTQSSVEGTESGYRVVDFSVNAEMIRPAVEDVEAAREDKYKKSVYLDESKGMWKCRHCNWTYKIGNHWVDDHIHQNHFTFGCRGTSEAVEKNPKVEDLSAKLKDVDIQKIVSAVISGKHVEILEEKFLSGSTLPPSTKPQEEDGTTSMGLKIDVVDEIDEEVIELEFERAVEKMHTHEYNMYCPNCSSRITKVILRRRKREKKTQPQDLLGCLSCFSIFIPRGNILNPFKILRSVREPGSSQIPQVAPGSTLPQQHAPAGDTKPVKPNNNAAAYSSGNAYEPAATSMVGSTLNGNVILDIPDKLDGTMQGTQFPIKPIGDGVGQNITYGQHPVGVQFPPEQGPIPTAPSTVNLPDITTPLLENEARSSRSFEILKSIVYGGLMESMASLSLVASAAAAKATTLNIVALGLSNLVGGLIVFGHNLKDLKWKESTEINGATSRYQRLLGRKENFALHATFALLSYLVFGLTPPAIYGFTFRGTDDRDFKLLAVAASSLLCVFFLAIAKAYTRCRWNPFKEYLKTAMYYVTAAVLASGIAYAVGHLFNRLMEKLGWFDANPVAHLSIPY